jgi:hypothetical protein
MTRAEFERAIAVLILWLGFAAIVVVMLVNQ